MVITVGRQYGSGGREIGTMLAQQLGIAYYDDMLLKEAAEESGLCEELFRSFDERPKSFLYSIAMDPYSFSMNHVTPKGSIEQHAFVLQLSHAHPSPLSGNRSQNFTNYILAYFSPFV